MRAELIILIILLLSNVVMLALYLSARSSAPKIGYDKQSKERLKSRVTKIREELEEEIKEVDTEEWLDKVIEEEIRNI